MLAKNPKYDKLHTKSNSVKASSISELRLQTKSQYDTIRLPNKILKIRLKM